MKYRVRHVVEYALLRGLTALAGALPHRVALALAGALAALARGPARRRLRAAAARVAEVYGERFTPRARRIIVRRAWRHLFCNAVEVMRVPRMTRNWINRVVVHSEMQTVFDSMQAGRGAIIAVPHMGNWELAGVAAQLYGARVMIIVRRQKNPLTNAYLNQLREYTGVEAWQREGRDFSGLVRSLKEGKVLAILPDLRAKTNAIRVNFLGHQADIPGGMALFARESGAPIVPAYACRVGWARHAWKCFAPIWPDPALDQKTDMARMTQYVMTCFDQAINAHPDQYFWFNQRWILEPQKDLAPGG
ncbi:MAG: lysophospholipid acyltransferase family protein [Kiritimatiellaeota bacterium]|nr:lysophospholipid acyltransferase family protein [Kiritimatiellota bacterium]